MAPQPNDTTVSAVDTPTGVVRQVRVVSRAGHSEIAGIRYGRLLIRLAAAPVDGAANDALLKLLAQALRLPSRQVQLLAGQGARDKQIRIVGLAVADVHIRLCAALE